MGDNVLRRSRFVVGDVVDPRLGPVDRKVQGTRDIGYVNAVEHLAGFYEAPGLAFPEVLERIPAGTVDPGQAEYLDRNAMLRGEIQPGVFGGNTLHRAFGNRPAGCVFIYPGSVVIAVDANGRQIAEPVWLAGRDIVAMLIEHRISCLVRRDRHQHMRRRLERLGDACTLGVAVKQERGNTHLPKRICLFLRAGCAADPVKLAAAFLDEGLGRKTDAKDEETHGFRAPDVCGGFHKERRRSQPRD